jgi:hypothetical protein
LHGEEYGGDDEGTPTKAPMKHEVKLLPESPELSYEEALELVITCNKLEDLAK